MAILALAALAAPGLWWRTPPPPAIERPAPGGWDLMLQAMSVTSREMGEARVAGAWVMDSDYPGFGGYSALVRLDDGRLFAASDTGRMVVFAPPGAGPAPAQMGWFAGRREPTKFAVDIEAMTRDPTSGRVWLAYEGRNAIERYEPGLRSPRRVQPAAMRGWPSNTGPETLVRLADGRFLVLSESHGGWFGTGHAGLLFPSDPIEGGEPVRFVMKTPRGLRPVDAAQLPDGRIAVLLRRVQWLPPDFVTRVVVADPAKIREGGTWTGREIAAISSPGPSENYEGLAVEPLPGGAVRLWLISDDNRSAIQRTQLLALDWRP